MGMKIEAHALTDVGIQREANEDAYAIINSSSCYVVADGMGGHASGQVASRLAVDKIQQYITELASRPGHEYNFPVPHGCGPAERLLSNAIQWANERIFVQSLKKRELQGMGTTVVTAMAYDSFLVLSHVGDSRVYRFRDGVLEQMTRDHSLLNHYIDQGRIRTDKEAREFKDKNIIVQALGLKDYVDPDVSLVDCAENDLFLLCTDGLTDQVEDWIISNVMSGNDDDLPAACQTLVRLSNEAGGVDNVTVMILRISNATESTATVEIDAVADGAAAARPKELIAMDRDAPTITDMDAMLTGDEPTDPDGIEAINPPPIPGSEGSKTEPDNQRAAEADTDEKNKTDDADPFDETVANFNDRIQDLDDE